MRISANATCPCGSGHKLKRCCGAYHRGRPAAPAILMRARYTAYAVGDVDFLIRTTHPQGPVFRTDTRAWARELRAYCQETRFLGLAVLDFTDVAGVDRATVTFRAQLEVRSEVMALYERSLFLRDAGRWMYHSGELDPADREG